MGARRTESILPGVRMQVTSFSQMVYFSFVTMSTLGYGDITPRSPVAQTFAWMQSVAGQFYIAVLVAWMVSEIPRRRSSAHGEAAQRSESVADS